MRLRGGAHAQLSAADRRLQCDSGKLLILGHEVPDRPLCDSVEVLVPCDALLIERIQCDPGELLIERPQCD